MLYSEESVQTIRQSLSKVLLSNMGEGLLVHQTHSAPWEVQEISSLMSCTESEQNLGMDPSRWAGVALVATPSFLQLG